VYGSRGKRESRNTKRDCAPADGTAAIMNAVARFDALKVADTDFAARGKASMWARLGSIRVVEGTRRLRD
jgi:hypothetical protein